MEYQRKINEEELRKEAITQIETEMLFMPLAGINLLKAEHCDLDELIKLARECGIDIDKFYLDQ